MKDLRTMKNDELKDIARSYTVVGAWKMNKNQLIAAIITNANINGHADMYFDSEAQNDSEQLQIVPESTETTSADNSSGTSEEATERDSEDYTIVAKNSDNGITVIAECHHEDIIQDNSEAIEAEDEEPRVIKKPSLKIKELTFDGRTQTIKEWAAELEMPWPTLYDRINRNGWTVEEALTIPLGGRRKRERA